MTDTLEEDTAIAIAIEDGCGLMLGKRRALCDDPKAPMECRPQVSCACRNSAKAALGDKTWGGYKDSVTITREF